MDVCIFLKSPKPDTVDWRARPPFVSCFKNPHSPSPQLPFFKAAAAEYPANHFLKFQGHWINDVFIWQPQVGTIRRVFRGNLLKLHYWWSMRNYKHLVVISWAQERRGTTPQADEERGSGGSECTNTHSPGSKHGCSIHTPNYVQKLQTPTMFLFPNLYHMYMIIWIFLLKSVNRKLTFHFNIRQNQSSAVKLNNFHEMHKLSQR